MGNAVDPFFEALFSLFPVVAIFLLEFSNELVPLPIQLGHVFTGKSSEFFTERTGELLPFPFNLIAIHQSPPLRLSRHVDCHSGVAMRI
jgi:hypothetical protein